MKKLSLMGLLLCLYEHAGYNSHLYKGLITSFTLNKVVLWCVHLPLKYPQKGFCVRIKSISPVSPHF